jgi:alpha,alpha-trehalase
MISCMPAHRKRQRSHIAAILAVVAVFIVSGKSQKTPASDAQLLAGLDVDFDRLAPQTIRPAEGFIARPYLVPAGYYPQMWDWDGFFIGAHWANQSPAKAILLRDWVLNFAAAADADGYVAGCITPKGPRPLFGKFAMKPFLAQGAVIAAGALNDYEWIRPAWPAMQRIVAYRRKTQFDEHWNLWFWDNAMQSGADNSPALTNEENDRSAILAVDASVWAMREYEAMALIAWRLGDKDLAIRYKAEADATRAAILKHLWRKEDALFLNRRRDNGAWIRAVTWSSFVPLAFGMLDEEDARRMIREHLLNPAEMRSPFGFRSVAKSDLAYNNDAIIVPYSNWRGPIWINANFLDWLALRRYGFSAEAHWLAGSLAEMLWRDIAAWGSMHEDYNAETGDGLAPTPAQSPGGKFAGFVGWNMLAQDMLECEVTRQHCMTMEIVQGN